MASLVPKQAGAAVSAVVRISANGVHDSAFEAGGEMTLIVDLLTSRTSLEVADSVCGSLRYRPDFIGLPGESQADFFAGAKLHELVDHVASGGIAAMVAFGQVGSVFSSPVAPRGTLFYAAHSLSADSNRKDVDH